MNARLFGCPAAAQKCLWFVIIIVKHHHKSQCTALHSTAPNIYSTHTFAHTCTSPPHAATSETKANSTAAKQQLNHSDIIRKKHTTNQPTNQQQ